ncbi:hypothetical protein FACS1894206_06370 [Deltaproteobacteria bacterium]|nr:hypothetical protein FACS1894206_06370 [Deltaproteobacteria bacterium]
MQRVRFHAAVKTEKGKQVMGKEQGAPQKDSCGGKEERIHCRHPSPSPMLEDMDKQQRQKGKPRPFMESVAGKAVGQRRQEQRDHAQIKG